MKKIIIAIILMIVVASPFIVNGATVSGNNVQIQMTDSVAVDINLIPPYDEQYTTYIVADLTLDVNTVTTAVSIALVFSLLEYNNYMLMSDYSYDMTVDSPYATSQLRIVFNDTLANLLSYGSLDFHVDTKVADVLNIVFVRPGHPVGDISFIINFGRDTLNYFYTSVLPMFSYSLDVIALGHKLGWLDGYELGYADTTSGFSYGFELGDERGYSRGFDIGKNTGLSQGEIIGYDKGLRETEERVYQTAYDKGANDSFLANFDKWIVPAIIIVLFGGGFIAIMNIRRRDE